MALERYSYGLRAKMNHSIRRVLSVAVVLVATASASQISRADARIPLRFRGDWQGTLLNATLPAKPEALKWNDPMHLRIVISANDVKLFKRAKGHWQQMGPSTFEIVIHDANAVITAIWDAELWEESWSLAASLVDTKHLHVAFTRQGNDKRVHRPDPDAVSDAIAYGTLERAPDVDN